MRKFISTDIVFSVKMALFCKSNIYHAINYDKQE